MSLPSTGLNPHQVAVKQTIDDLIQTATSYDIDELDRIYHDRLQVVMLDVTGELNHADKAGFKALFRSKKDAGDPPMNTWAKYHNVQADEENAHVLLSRKNNLSGVEMTLMLSIDLLFEDGRWQVVREVIFLRPSE